MLGDEKCQKCEGNGLYEWRTTELGKDIKQFISQTLDQYRDELIEEYTKFLIKNGYCDDDVWQENPTAIETFKENLKNKK